MHCRFLSKKSRGTRPHPPPRWIRLMASVAKYGYCSISRMSRQLVVSAHRRLAANHAAKAYGPISILQRSLTQLVVCQKTMADIDRPPCTNRLAVRLSHLPTSKYDPQRSSAVVLYCVCSSQQIYSFIQHTHKSSNTKILKNTINTGITIIIVIVWYVQKPVCRISLHTSIQFQLFLTNVPCIS